jgi:hypothetical protein
MAARLSVWSMGNLCSYIMIIRSSPRTRSVEEFRGYFVLEPESGYCPEVGDDAVVADLADAFVPFDFEKSFDNFIVFPSEHSECAQRVSVGGGKNQEAHLLSIFGDLWTAGRVALERRIRGEP